MALEFTEYGKNIVLRNMFGSGGLVTYANVSSGAESNTSAPTLAGSGANTASLGLSFFIQFYGGTRPNISTVSRSWQASAYAGSTKLWPASTTTATALNIGTILAGNQNDVSTYVNPTSKLTVDWTNNTITTNASTLATNLLFNAGTVTWFSVYGGFGTGTAGLTNYFLVFTGTVGATGSGADIEINRTDIPTNSYPVEVKRLSFKFPQPTGVDLIFNKDIYTTALINSICSGTTNARTGGGSSQTHVAHFASGSNSKYVFGSTANLVNLYTGTRPATPETAVPGDATLIASVNVGALTYGNMTFVNTASETSLTRTGNFFATAAATGNPTWCRIMSSTSGGYAALDCSAGLPGSGAAVIYQDAITSGMTVNLTSLKFSMA